MRQPDEFAHSLDHLPGQNMLFRGSSDHKSAGESPNRLPTLGPRRPGHADMGREVSPKSRDRDVTESNILRAAKEMLAEAGFQEFGINAIARRAGCDKQLIYRYFGGLEGVAGAIGEQLAVQLAEDLKPFSTASTPETYGDLMKILILGFLDLLRADRVMQQIIAWELAAPSPLVTRMVAERGQRLAAWMHEMCGDLKPPEGMDVPALNAVLVASTQHLVLSASTTGGFAGMPLQNDADWERVRHALVALVDSIYEPPGVSK